LTSCQQSSILILVKLVCIDSTAVVANGPGSPAYFSRYAIEHLKSLGHEVTITNGFYPDLCRSADAVWTEWANDDALEAAASGLCKKLIIRLRGYEAFGPLDRMEWANVDALVYESPFLKKLVEERFPGLRGFRTHVIPSGVDVASIPYRERGPGPVVAMVGRGVADKGFQLAFEWARQRRDIQFHAGIALAEPRLLRYLEYSKPPNVTIHHSVQTVKWLDEIDANYLLSASNWESLGYTIAEAMALGIKPLIHDTPGAEVNWPLLKPWRGLLNITGEMQSFCYDSHAYRAFVEEHLDAFKQSAYFAALLLAPAARVLPAPPSALGLILQVEAAIQANQLASADVFLLEFRDRTPRLAGLDDHRSGLALKLAAAYHNAGDSDRARVWALRSLGDTVRADALCLLGEVAAGEGDLENAERWYDASLRVTSPPTRYASGGLEDERGKRGCEIANELRPALLQRGQTPKRFLIVVAVRNADKYIGVCLDSIKQQTGPFHCVVIDDASTDSTVDEIVNVVGGTTVDARFRTALHTSRRYSLPNIVAAIRKYGEPGDVVVIVDGDDCLLPGALTAIEYAYFNKGAWMTYGNFRTTSGRPSWMPPYPRRVVQAGSYRTWPWCVSHPKTFKIELFNKLTDEDFTHEGQWFQTAGDVALMIPMLEMAAERAVYIPEMIYEWNDQNAQSDHRVDPDGQVRVRDLILSKPKRERLEGL
jgi:tetratricopeptide (TPR) repeat protein